MKANMKIGKTVTKISIHLLHIHGVAHEERSCSPMFTFFIIRTETRDSTLRRCESEIRDLFASIDQDFASTKSEFGIKTIVSQIVPSILL